MDKKLRRWLRPFLANFYYLRKPLREVLPIIGLVVIVVLLGAISFDRLYEVPAETVDGVPVENEREDVSFSEAVYITYCLIFMEHLYDYPDHWLLRFFYIVLPLLGLVVILDGFTRFGFHVLRKDSQEEWMYAMAKTFSDHVIVCGLGRVGLRTVQQLLKLDEEIIVLEIDPQNPNIPFAKKNSIPVLIGSGREEGILDKLGTAQAKSIILATDNDLINLEIAIDAREIRPDIRVLIRLFDQELANKIRNSFDIHLAFSTAAHAAPLLATSSSDRSIQNAFYIGDTLMVVAEISVNASSELIGKQIREVGAQYDLFILSHKRGETETRFPSASIEFQSGDSLVVQTVPETLRMLHKWNHDKGE